MHNIKQVVIAGGGSAGWMTAAALSKLLGEHVNITLVESAQIGTVSVGEATIPQIRQFNQLIGIDENEFLSATSGTFKLGIEFIDWGQIGQQYMHPFGPYGVNLNGIAFHHYWLKSVKNTNPAPILDYCLEGHAAKLNRFDRIVGQTTKGHSTLNYAFHFDAVKYAEFLSTLAIKQGVKHIQGTISQVTIEPSNGHIKDLILDDGQVISGELFIDCTGFKGRLINQALHVGFESWQHWLPCDSAIAIASESLPELKPYTQATAHNAGWQWQIPLQHRVGNGRVFASGFTSAEQQIVQLAAQLPSKAMTEPRQLNWQNGRRLKAWQKNCVAIGLSAGFLEPLESTGLQFIQSAILRLISLFPSCAMAKVDADTYNRYTEQEITAVRDFIICHYKVTKRSDSEFWRYCQHMDVPNTVSERLALFAQNGRLFRENNELFNELSWFSVLHGQGIEPQGYHPLVNSLSDAACEQYMQQIKTMIGQTARSLPMHSEYVARHCRYSKS
ncbi:tryptophan 7-halogenase [Pseudoalteromonas sp. NEC-BIFX-2020_015]|uniref:tryptophan halogenase family protein n=1 Tax=Pseudoalteromonas sp. NEC-BIFX-2020_015 TaxID=2729544 RepID=UPI00146164E7|nr:tryptophan halogenase family protein [Pseudoalteromonas sp. NEC-BIFX-2020_015]NMR26668.1 tryptophan 7-halogenase [Pseudoalteromonas sp. NEC-BIFX-2020_015]